MNWVTAQQKRLFISCSRVEFCFVPHQGASILLMLNSTLTEEEFRKGVIKYLQAHQFQNTKSEDLWNSLTNVSPFLNPFFTEMTRMCVFMPRVVRRWVNSPSAWPRWWTRGPFRKAFLWSRWIGTGLRSHWPRNISFWMLKMPQMTGYISLDIYHNMGKICQSSWVYHLKRESMTNNVFHFLFDS